MCLKILYPKYNCTISAGYAAKETCVYHVHLCDLGAMGSFDLWGHLTLPLRGVASLREQHYIARREQRIQVNAQIPALRIDDPRKTRAAPILIQSIVQFQIRPAHHRFQFPRMRMDVPQQTQRSPLTEMRIPAGRKISVQQRDLFKNVSMQFR